MTNSGRIMSSSSLTGEDVKNTAGENLGDIKDFMIDLDEGRIVYAVLSFGGILGMGDKLFAVPLGALTLDTEEKCFRLNASKEELKDAPGFDKANWPDMADRQWGEEIHSYYKTPPHWK